MDLIASFRDRVTAKSGFRPEDVVLSDRLAWANDSADNDLDDWPGFGWDADGYEPTDEEAAELLGWELALDGEPQPEDRGYTLRAEAFVALVRGHAHGSWERRERAWREEVEYEAWLREMAEEREAELMLEDARSWHEAERAAVVGAVENRKA